MDIRYKHTVHVALMPELCTSPRLIGNFFNTPVIHMA